MNPLFDLSYAIQILNDWYSELKQTIVSIYMSCPLSAYTQNFDWFDGLVCYSVCLMILIWTFNKLKCPSKNYNISYLQYFKAQAFLMCVKYLPGVGGYLEKKKEQALDSFSKSINKLTSKKTFKLPENGMTQDRINERLQEWNIRDKQLHSTGKVSGSLYIPNDSKFEQNVEEFTKHFVYSNPMHADLWPASRQMEAEIIKMTGDLFGQDKEAIGITTSGGTESILLAILAYRNWARDVKGITKPNLVLPETAHAAFYKAGEFFNVEVRIAKINQKTYQVDVNDVRSKIDSNTICLVGSVPNFPYGVHDPIEQLAQLAHRKQIGFHVDCCLGGFVVAFAKENNMLDIKFDFNLEGVTSLSCDQHKYGLAPKGVSTVFYRTKRLREYAFFSIATWSGGVYVTPSLAGSKSGAGIAGAWYVMQSVGRKRYAEYAKVILQATKSLNEQLQKLPEIEVFGNPQICAVAFKSRSKSLSVYSVSEILHHQGWTLSTTQKPAGIHISVTHQNAGNIDVLVTDVKNAIAEVLSNPKLHNGGGAQALYGTTQKIPDDGFAGEVLKLYTNQVLKI